METEIIAGEKRLCAAMLASDVAVLDELIDDEILFVGPTGELISKIADLELHRSGGIQVTRLEPQEQQIRCLGDVAIVVTRIALAGRFLGADFAGDYRYTRVWQRGGAGFRIVAGHCSAIAG